MKVVELPGQAKHLYCTVHTVHKLYTHWRTCVYCTVYCSIAEEFKSDDEVNISTESKDAEATEEVYIFLENRTNFYCELLGS